MDALFDALFGFSGQVQNASEDEGLGEMGAMPDMPGVDALRKCFQDPKVKRQALKWKRFLSSTDMSEEQLNNQTSPFFPQLISVITASSTQPGIIQERVALLKANVAKEGLVPHDVFPDGNCLFAAVVDQCRVRGNFVYSANSLRQRAVEYLRSHPTQADGTHLSEFLVDESWEVYLSRMADDGEPADDIIVGALVEVIKKPMVIIEGISCQNRTKLRPNQHEESRGQSKKEKVDFSGNMDPSPGDSPSHGLLDYANQFASGDSATDEGYGGRSHKDCIYIAHVTETHYVSLRESEWEAKLYEELLEKSKRRAAHEETECHLNFMLRYIRYCNVIERDDKQSHEGLDAIDDMYTHVKSETTVDLTGPLTEGLLCSVTRCEQSDLDTEHGFQNSNQGPNNGQPKSIMQFTTPHDSVVLQTDSTLRKLPPDLIADDSLCPTGYARLLPVNTEMWSNALAVDIQGKDGHLRHLEMKQQKRMGSTLMDFMNVNDAFQYNAHVSFKCQWPNVASEWLTRERPSKWPSEDVVKEVVKNGCKVIPECHPNSRFLNTEWKYSFAVAEKVLARKHITESQRYCFWVLSLLLKNFGGHSELTHDHVRTIFFYTCESAPKSEWDKCPGTCLKTMLDKLLQCLCTKSMPSYFMQKLNMLEDMPSQEITAIQNTVKLLLHNLPVTVYFLMDKYGHMMSNIGLMTDSIFQNIRDKPQSGNEHMHLQDVFDLETVQLIQAFLLKDDLKTAKTIFIVEIEGLARFQESDSMLRIFQAVIKCSGILTAWCFAFSFIETHGAIFLDSLNEGLSTISISTILGDDFLNHVPFRDIQVPEVCVDETTGRVISFVLKATTVMLDLHLYEAILSGVRYFLSTYAHIVEEHDAVVEVPSRRRTHSSKEDTGSKMSFKIASLQMIYTNLYCACRKLGKQEAFLGYMDTYERLCDHEPSSPIFNCVASMWEDLGCYERAEAAREKARKLGSSGGRFTLLLLR